MNIILHHHITIWNAKYENDRLYLYTSIGQFKNLKPAARKARCRIKIVAKKGLPFLLFKYRKRSLWMVGTFLFVSMLYFLASFVWLIEVTGNEKLQETQVIECLEKAGYETGKLKNKMDLRQAEYILMNTYPEIVWAGIQYRGTKMLVQIAEAVPKPEMHEVGEPCDLIAKRDGLITYIATDKGMPRVKKGDTVTKDAILVTGQIQLEDEKGSFYYTESKAKIKAKTIYSLQAKTSLSKIQKNYTQQVSSKWGVRLFKNRLTLWNPKIPYPYYDTLITVWQLSITELFPLPFYIEKQERIAYIPIRIKKDKETAKDCLIGALNDTLIKKVSQDAKILKQEISYFEENGYLKAKLNVLVEENIAVTQPIKTTISQVYEPVEGEN